MQKSATRTTPSNVKVAKKPKKMGTPSPPKKKKSELDKKATVKKPTVVSKKSNIGKKDLRLSPAKKKTSPVKLKSSQTKGIKRPAPKKTIKPKPTLTKPTDDDNTEETVSKAKKAKKSDEPHQNQNEITKKTTAKPKINSKLNKKPIVVVDAAVKSPLPIQETPPRKPKKVPKPKMPPKPKQKPILKTLKKIKKEFTKTIESTIPITTTTTTPKIEPDLSKIDDTISSVIENYKPEIKPDLDKLEDINTQETIALLLKEANKSIKLSSTKKRIKTISSIVKKSKMIQPKIVVKTEPEDEKPLDEKALKNIKKKIIKLEETPVLIPVPKQEPEDQEEKNTHTDDSTTSDDLTLNQIRQNTTPVPSEPTVSKKVAKKPIKVEPPSTSDSEKKPKPKVVTKLKPKVTATKKLQHKKKLLLLKKKAAKIKNKKRSLSVSTDSERGRKLKLYSWWTGPKRHRVASLNAAAKVHCLYENETRGALYDSIKHSPTPPDSDPIHEPKVEPQVEASTRTLRSVPGLRGVGKCWENNETSSTSSSSSCEENSNDSSVESPTRKLLVPPPSYKQKQQQQKEQESTKQEQEKEKEKKKPIIRKRRKGTELMMDLKDMVVRKRMASLNASAILAASYSVEKKSFKSPKSETSEEESGSDSDASVMMDDKESKRKCYEEDVKKEEDRKLIEVRASPNKKVAVILNQDTDVTITGVYVNSTTRSTHHEGYCSIAGMQYRISATSHTQTAATAVATETLLHSATDHSGNEQPMQVPCKSYTPLGALSNMQPPGSHVPPPPPPLSPSGRRHGCPSAFTAPPAYGPPPPPPPHHHHPPGPPPPPPTEPPPTYIHGYYQPAGPLITAHHGHSHPPPAPSGKTAPLPTLEASPSPTPPPQTTHQPPPSSTGTAESSDNEVIITSASSGAEPVAVQLPPPTQTYRYATQYPPAGATHAPPGYSYSYPPSQYYHSAPSGFPQQQHYHHDICYPGSSYPPSYLHPKAYTTTFRRYLPAPTGPQYYPANPDLYSAPPANAQSSQVVTAVSSGGTTGSSSYQPPPTGPPPPTLVETYAPPPPVPPPTIVEPYPPPHYYTSYGTGPAPPACYTHSPPTRNLAFIDATYQSCPCPMQSCPKNVHTGPLIGDGKRSNVTTIAKESMPLPPVALALPLEPASVAGPPSPARGSAGMPPPPSPAGATYQPTAAAQPPTKWCNTPPATTCATAKQEETTETVLECKVTTTTTAAEKQQRCVGKARVGKTMVRNSINMNQGLLMCHNTAILQKSSDEIVKREVESPEEIVKVPVSPESQQKHDRILDEVNQTETKQEEVQILDRLDEEINQNLLKNEDEDDDIEDRLSDEILSPKEEIETKEEIKPGRITVKRKLSVDEEEIPENHLQVKKQKIKTKPLNNGSYKDLIKKNNINNNNNNIKAVINNGKRKVEPQIPAAIAAVTIEQKFLLCKTPKIMLGRGKKTKRKPPAPAVKDESLHAKRAKTSRPLVASNLHNSKQNTTSKKQIDEPLVRNNSKQPNKYRNKLTNIDRTIESVVQNSVIETERTTCEIIEASVLKNECDVNHKTIVTDNDDITATTTTTTTTTNRVLPPQKVTKTGCGRSGASKRKSKIVNSCPLALPISRIPRKSLHLPRWSNGWSWEGEHILGKVFLTSDEDLVTRRCYMRMRHMEGDVISPGDCVLLKAGQRKVDLPFVAKVVALWEDDEGEMMMSLLWYYRPEHTEQGRRPVDQPDEVFASRHKDTNSVACIEDKCYVLTFNEYCRYRKHVKRLEEGIDHPGPVVPLPEGGAYHRQHRQPPIPVVTAPDLVFFCRQVYDFRQKRISRNPS